MAFLWLINRGDPDYLLIGMILQVHGGEKDHGIPLPPNDLTLR